jgi:hypothetical protein
MKVNIEFDLFVNEDGDLVLATDDVRFHGPEGGDGLYLPFNEHVPSANYHPAYRNRMIRFLRDHNQSAPTLSNMKALPTRHIRKRVPFPTVVVNGRKCEPVS